MQLDTRDGYMPSAQPSRPLTPRLRPSSTGSRATDLTGTLDDPWAGWLPGALGQTPPPFDTPMPQPYPAAPSRPLGRDRVFPAQLHTSGRLTPIPHGVLRTAHHDTPILWLPGYSPGIERADSAHPLLWPDERSEPARVTVRLPESAAPAYGADWRLVRVVALLALVVTVGLVAGVLVHLGGL